MSEIKELAMSVAFLAGVEAFDEINERLSQEDRDMFYSWFFSKWSVEWDKELIDQHLSKIEVKIKQLKEI